jgi:hypothetical protein
MKMMANLVWVLIPSTVTFEWVTITSQPESCKFTIESNVPFSPTSPTAQKAKLYFISFYTYHVIASGFS